MALANDVKSQVETIINTIFGSQFTKYSFTSTTDKWGDGTVSLGTGTVITAVYAQKFPLRLVQDKYGKIYEGEQKLYCKTGDSIIPETTIIGQGTTMYDVIEKKTIGFASVDIVDVCLLNKRL